VMPNVSVRLPARRQNYEIRIGAGLLSACGAETRAVLGADARRIAVISNATVFDLFGARALRSLQAAGFKTARWLMNDGEHHKSLRSLESALAFLAETGLERNDAIVALGGGVVGDLAGFAASIYLRGIRLIQAPTTLLAQIDSSVGGKTGVNLPAGKNLIGAFHQPSLVLIDTDTLKTLPQRELTAGWCEAVKQGAAGDRKLLERTCTFLRNGSGHLDELIAAHCRFKASIVMRDELEDVNRFDHRSRRILNFGHTTAHALESVTGYKRFKHGEAVGHGMLVAGEISKSLGMFRPNELESLREAVRLCGPLPKADDLAIEKIIGSIRSDKKSVGGKVNWILLDHLGRAHIVSGNEIDRSQLRSAMRAGLKSFS
jgi:3-dehydroquinate synthase